MQRSPLTALIALGALLLILIAAPTAFAEELAEEPQDQTVEEEQETTTTTTTEREATTRQLENWTWVIGRNALAGGVTGALIGVGFFLLTGTDTSPWLIAQFAGGGILVGTTIGLVELLVTSDRMALEPPASTQFLLREMPEVRPVGGLELRF
jgi:hypothetical protein